MELLAGKVLVIVQIKINENYIEITKNIIIVLSLGVIHKPRGQDEVGGW